ncbi:septum formation protein Maf [Candidatus Kaiserbacteria bacterium RIFCSPHIGHO2_02_FULL_54_11b]|uniref:Nucleoside triphosphate pyrophosphatase n=2 Tax=Candidatus Kaiseribacteriota TaxID=1752734 RepID=A0A1F6CMV8_9BACT|nr:MAG: septum formation protein Maf [Candidatus Kaiserbacteria bacterium RIFCSPHIGHO2_01_FULL_54_36b]OGG65002.1 MAG: septum formation protein Maf [Candidatus Kaiserbacteria bacterium RIFCSPHIGHO2_02_FULL_54_11b]
MQEIILASSSKQRHDILKCAGIPFVVEDSGYEEDLTLPLPPRELVVHLAGAKAAAVATRHPNALVIGVDTVVVCTGEVFGKPDSFEHAREILQTLSGKAHSIFTGFVIIDGKTGQKVTRTVETKVHFKQLSEADIDAYVKTGEPLGKAGGYAIQGAGVRFVERIEGDMDNVVGLPLGAVLEELAKFGVL